MVFWKNTTAVLLCVLLLTYCKSVSSISRSSEGEFRNGNILFATIEIRLDESDQPIVTMLSKNWSPGQLRNLPQHDEASTESIRCVFLTENKKVSKVVTVKNPLFYQPEEYSPDGTIKRHDVKLRKAQFTIRTELTADVKFLSVESNDQKIGLLNL